MLNNSDNILTNLRRLGLGMDEAKVYMELLREPSTHLRLSHNTGINRTTIYRVVEDLEKKSLISRRTDDRGTFLTASDPSTLEVGLVTKEERLKQQRLILDQLVPQLNNFTSKNNKIFTVQTYEGVEGIKQMCWHVLQTKDEVLGFGAQTMEDLTGDHRWAEKVRERAVEAGFLMRQIINEDTKLSIISSNKEYLKRYNCRTIPSKKIFFNEHILIYNDTVAIFNWQENQKVGVEIVSKTYTQMMREVFENFWQIAK